SRPQFRWVARVAGRSTGPAEARRETRWLRRARFRSGLLFYGESSCDREYRAVAPWCLPGLQAERDSLDSRESDIGRRHDDAAVDIATLPHHASIARTAPGGLPPAHPRAGRVAYLRRSAP